MNLVYIVEINSNKVSYNLEVMQNLKLMMKSIILKKETKQLMFIDKILYFYGYSIVSEMNDVLHSF